MVISIYDKSTSSEMVGNNLDYFAIQNIIEKNIQLINLLLALKLLYQRSIIFK